MRIASGILLTMALAGCSALDDQMAQIGGASDATGSLFVANKRGDSLSRIDLSSGEESIRVATCDNPHELSVSPDGAHVALACYGGSSLEIFATQDLARVAQVELGIGARPHGVVWHDSGMLVASAEGRGSIFTVNDALSDAPQVQEIGSEGEGPHLIVVDEAGVTAWGAVIPTGTVVRYDLALGEETGRQRLGGDTEGIALSADGGALWVGANSANRAYRLDPVTLEVTAEVTTGNVPIRLAAHPSQDLVVSSDFGDGALTVVDSASGEVVRQFAVSGEQDSAQVTLVFSQDGERIYAAETANDVIAEIDFASGEVLRRLQAGAGGDGMAIIN